MVDVRSKVRYRARLSGSLLDGPFSRSCSATGLHHSASTRKTPGLTNLALLPYQLLFRVNDVLTQRMSTKRFGRIPLEQEVQPVSLDPTPCQINLWPTWA
ncbi:hypothetical protein RRG08_062340 [Elysia crispata]|uniref:Uncharacterized protein n=1 Tax=Elysia crispata TaxID=231223 RepID=A0AAE0YHY9_9GAST|nr:hypothetical protein RRG08_062340 [Elysia crispata]